jgi:hypothetical protein
MGLPVGGETAESPDVVVDPVLAFCASANELLKITTVATAIVASFISSSFVESAGHSLDFGLGAFFCDNFPPAVVRQILVTASLLELTGCPIQRRLANAIPSRNATKSDPRGASLAMLLRTLSGIPGLRA